jgi:hypothetical protein
MSYDLLESSKRGNKNFSRRGDQHGFRITTKPGIVADDGKIYKDGGWSVAIYGTRFTC